MICVHSPHSVLSTADRQVILDFQRFLGTVGYPTPAVIRYLRWQHPRGYAWIDYMLGETGAPPLMWEGDDS